MNKRSGKLASVGVAVGTIAALALSGTAHAEASWESSISGANSGFESRTWYDNNMDSTNGYLWFSRCNYSPTVAVYREATGPDVEVARGKITCNGGDGYLYFGDVAKGNYHFTIKSSGTLNVSRLVVVY
ncbi:hypothetical protein, partial [Micromonospora arida]|uniref:hypothetical protein n=1 Tax=Micromonospora arida TaxID=2203715 RepID=UPI0033A90572